MSNTPHPGGRATLWLGLGLALIGPALYVVQLRIGRAVTPAHEAGAHSLPLQIGQLALDRLAEDVHQRVDLALRPRPVLGRERIDDERLEPEVDRRFDRPPERLRPGAMALGDGQPTLGRPAAVAIHDDRDRPGMLARLPAVDDNRVRRAGH